MKKLQEKLKEKLDKCNSCPFEDYEVNWYDKETGTGKLCAHIYPESDCSVMIVGQNPSHRRSKGVYAMCGRQGDVFREIFTKKHLVFTNLIQISTPDNKVDHLSNDQIKHCIEHLLYEIKEIKPKLIIVCSSFGKRKLNELNYKLDIVGSAVKFIKHPDFYLTYHKGDIIDYYKEIIDIRNETFARS